MTNPTQDSIICPDDRTQVLINGTYIAVEHTPYPVQHIEVVTERTRTLNQSLSQLKDLIERIDAAPSEGSERL